MFHTITLSKYNVWVKEHGKDIPPIVVKRPRMDRNYIANVRNYIDKVHLEKSKILLESLITKVIHHKQTQ